MTVVPVRRHYPKCQLLSSYLHSPSNMRTSRNIYVLTSLSAIEEDLQTLSIQERAIGSQLLLAFACFSIWGGANFGVMLGWWWCSQAAWTLCVSCGWMNLCRSLAPLCWRAQRVQRGTSLLFCKSEHHWCVSKCAFLYIQQTLWLFFGFYFQWIEWTIKRAECSGDEWRNAPTR